MGQRDETASDAVAKLLETQMPWGEWGAVGESPEVRYARRMRPEYRYNPIPKANVFRTVVALESLRGVKHLRPARVATTRAVKWLKERLLQSNHTLAPGGGVWTAHVAIPTGIGLGFHIPDLVNIIDLRHTSQAWSALLWRNAVTRTNHARLKQAAETTLKIVRPDHLWGNIQGSERPNTFATACCASFLQCAHDILTSLQPKHEAADAAGAAAKACSTLSTRIRGALQQSLRPEPAEEAGRSLWIIARAGLQKYFDDLREPVSYCLDPLLHDKSDEAVDSYRAAIRLAAAARQFDWPVREELILRRYWEFLGELHPPDFAFVLLVLLKSNVTKASCNIDHRNTILRVALQERLEVFEWLQASNQELLAEAIVTEQTRYVHTLVEQGDLRFQFRSVPEIIGKRDVERLRPILEVLEASRRKLLKGKGKKLALVDRSGANREITKALHRVDDKEARSALGELLYACYRLREFHEHFKFPPDLIQREDAAASFVALEFEALGIHLESFQSEQAPGRPDLEMKLTGCSEKVVVEFKRVKEKRAVKEVHDHSLDQGREWVRGERQKVERAGAQGTAQVANYQGPYCRLVIVCCLFQEDKARILRTHGFKVKVDNDLGLVIVTMNLYLATRPASVSARSPRRS